MEQTSDSLKHFCGIVGIHSIESINMPPTLFFPLFAQQHRGQESAGIAYRKPTGNVVCYKDLGMVSSVLSHYLSEDHQSNIGIGHVRYSTSGGKGLENVQPLAVSCNKGNIALAHNGNISNAQVLRDQLVEAGAIFQTTSDSELMTHFLAHEREQDFEKALVNTLNKLEGAFSMVIVKDNSLIAVRDPNGFRPLYMGMQEGKTVFASETCALDIMKIDHYRSVEPGEVVIVDENGVRSFKYAEEKKSQCVFELIYFARPDSEIFDKSVYKMRKKMGCALYEQDGDLGADVVVSVPDSGNVAALGYAEASGLPFQLGLTRNHYTGRSFIAPSPEQRELMVRMKLNPVKEVIKGKKVVLVDDSLVRGTTSKILVKILKEAGAAEVHLRLSSPELHWPCFYGIDIPTRGELISNRMTPAEIAKFIQADSVEFLSVENLKKCVGEADDFCYACFNGDYPFPTNIQEG